MTRSPSPSLPPSLFFFFYSPCFFLCFSLFSMSTWHFTIFLESYFQWPIVKSLSPFIFLCSSDIRPVKICYSQKHLMLFVPITVNTSILIKTFRSTLSVPKALLTYQEKLWITVLLHFLCIIQSSYLKIFP